MKVKDIQGQVKDIEYEVKSKAGLVKDNSLQKWIKVDSRGKKSDFPKK